MYLFLSLLLSSIVTTQIKGFAEYSIDTAIKNRRGISATLKELEDTKGVIRIRK